MYFSDPRSTFVSITISTDDAQQKPGDDVIFLLLPPIPSQASLFNNLYLSTSLLTLYYVFWFWKPKANFAWNCNWLYPQFPEPGVDFVAIPDGDAHSAPGDDVLPQPPVRLLQRHRRRDNVRAARLRLQGLSHVGDSRRRAQRVQRRPGAILVIGQALARADVDGGAEPTPRGKSECNVGRGSVRGVADQDRFDDAAGTYREVVIAPR